jgi:predicted dehydrogenase
MLKAGVIGLGVGEQHIAGFERDKRCEVISLCDTSEEQLSKVAARHPGKKLFSQAFELIDDPLVDIVSVASYDDVHYEQIVYALNKGKHVFVEKPICQTTKQLNAIQALLAENPSLTFSSNLILRLCPRFQQLRKMIQDGEIGIPYCVEGSYNYGRLHKIIDGWRGKLDFYSITQGGGIHLIDLLSWLIGSRVVEVSAFGTNLASADANLNFDDTVIAILKFENNAVGRVTSNFPCTYPHFHELSVFGTKATFQNGREHGILFKSRDPEEEPILLDTPYPGVHKGDLIHDFVLSILDGSEPEVTVKDIMHTMDVCLAIDKALESGTIVTVGNC